MSDYSKGQIYKLTCLDPNIKEIYVGSTVNFEKRKGTHKSFCKTKQTRLYKYIRDNGDWNNWNMILIKKFPCNSKRELEAEEDKSILQLKATLNSQSAIVHRETKQCYNKKYEKTEKCKQRRLKYRQSDKVKKQISLNSKKYQEKNKEKISNQNKEKVSCECGSIITKGCLTKHKKRTNHQVYDFLSFIENSLPDRY